MKTAEEFYIERFGGEGYTTRRSPSKANVIAAMNEFAKEVAMQTLKNVSEKSQDMMYYVADEADDNIEGLLRLKRRVMQSCYAVPKQIVLNKSNIPEL